MSLTQKLKLIGRGINFLFKSITFLLSLKCKTIFAYEYPTISPSMCKYTLIIHGSQSFVGKCICLQPFMYIDRPGELILWLQPFTDSDCPFMDIYITGYNHS